MSDSNYVGRWLVLAGIDAAALAACLNPTLARGQALDRPPTVLVFDVGGHLNKSDE